MSISNTSVPCVGGSGGSDLAFFIIGDPKLRASHLQCVDRPCGMLARMNGRTRGFWVLVVIPSDFRYKKGYEQ